MKVAVGSPRAQALWQLAVAAGLATLLWFHGAIGLVLLLAFAVVSPPAVAFAPVRPGQVLRAYLPFALAWLGFLVGYLRVMAWLGRPVAPQPALVELAQQGFGLPNVWPTLAGIVLLAPLLEELLFRGYLFTGLRSCASRWVTHGVTAALFGLVHGLDYALPIGVLSLLFGWLRERQQALLPAMLAHAVHNGITVVVTIAWPGHIDLLYPR